MSNTILLSDEQMKALQSGQSITIEPPKPVIAKWEPRGGNYCANFADYIVPIGVVSNSPSIERITAGIQYQTNIQAEQAAKALRSYARQLAWLAENDDGRVADWDNNRQPKFRIYFDTRASKYDYYSAVMPDLGTQYMSKENAYKLCQLLNDGIVEF